MLCPLIEGVVYRSFFIRSFFFSITMIAVLQILRRFGQELEGRVVDTV